MARKLKALAEGADGKADLNQLARTIRDSAQQIWLAGLGAFSKAQDEGGKVFEALVKEGLNLQRRTRAVTEERLGAVGQKMTRAAGDLSKQATESWDRLEQVFEDRVSRALLRLGVPTSREIAELSARVDALNEAVQSMMGGAAKAPARRSAAKAVKATKATKARASTQSARAGARSAMANGPAKAARTPAKAPNTAAGRAGRARAKSAAAGRSTS
ncbi:MAG TPA: phasin family protein [Zeimonas sp.]|nr:phasin family protein [Zeimonas sp.]